MNGSATAGRWLLPADLANPTPNPEIELIMAGWAAIAAAAWEGFQKYGRGMVLIDGEELVAYLSGPPCTCCRHLVDTYNPEQQAVVTVSTGATHIVAGWPAPPDAFRITPAERQRLTAQ